MSYLLDKSRKRKKFSLIALGVVLFVLLFLFRAGIFGGLSYASHLIFRPVLVAGNGVLGAFGSLRAYFVSKNSLYEENENLRSQIAASLADRANYDSVVAENLSLKESLGRKDPDTTMALSAILEKPNQSPYDTLVIDAGTDKSFRAGNTVFAFGSVPIGRIAETYPSSSKVILFSNPGERTQVVIGNRPASPDTDQGGTVYIEVVGRGGGNFEMVMPHDFAFKEGDQAVLPGIKPYVVGVVQSVISDPRDPFTKALLTAPVNIQELKFVEVKI